MVIISSPPRPHGKVTNCKQTPTTNSSFALIRHSVVDVGAQSPTRLSKSSSFTLSHLVLGTLHQHQNAYVLTLIIPFALTLFWYTLVLYKSLAYLFIYLITSVFVHCCVYGRDSSQCQCLHSGLRDYRDSSQCQCLHGGLRDYRHGTYDTSQSTVMSPTPPSPSVVSTISGTTADGTTTAADSTTSLVMVAAA